MHPNKIDAQRDCSAFVAVKGGFSDHSLAKNATEGGAALGFMGDFNHRDVGLLIGGRRWCRGAGAQEEGTE